MIDIELLLPQGWVQIHTAPGTEKLRAHTIETIIRVHLPDTLPRDRAEPWRREIRKKLLAAADEAAEQGARSVLMPLTRLEGVPLPGSLLVTILEDDPGESAEGLLASILADAGPDGTFLEIAGGPAVRVAAVVESDRIERTAPARRVSYYVAHPDEPGVWGLLTFSVLTDGDLNSPAVEAVVLLFDAVVSTLRWHERDSVPTQDEILAQMIDAGPGRSE